MTEWFHRLRGVALLCAFVAVFLYVLSYNFRGPGVMDPVQGAVVSVVAPVADALKRAGEAVSGVFSQYAALREAGSENERLRADVARLSRELNDYREAHMENQRLRRLLDFRDTARAETVAARVVLHDPTGWFQTLMVDKGKKDGIGPDMPVVTDEGVIGRTTEVSDHYTRLILVTDPESAVDALIQRNRVRGILGGKDAGNCVLKYVRGNLDVQPGDVVVTSGKDGIFPKGLRLGVVRGVFKDPVNLFQRIEVEPAVRLGAIEEALVLKRTPLTFENPVVE